jgi:hypothetical protein
MKCHMFCTEGLRFQFVSLGYSGLLLLTLKKNLCFAHLVNLWIFQLSNLYFIQYINSDILALYSGLC